VFRAFAHNVPKGLNKSDFTANRQCTTAACELTELHDGDFCTKSQGFFGGNGGPGLAALQCYFTTHTSVVIGSGSNTYTWSLTNTDIKKPGTGPNNGTLVAGSNSIDDGIDALRLAIGGGGASGQLSGSAANPVNMGTGGGLASQTAALTLDVALSGSSCISGSCDDQGYPQGYGSVRLCDFAEGDTFKNDGTPISAATAAALNGQTVNQVLAAANAYLGGSVVLVPYGLGSAGNLNELVDQLNLAFDLKDWDNNGTDDCACGGMTAFAESHLCPAA
jgi:hypothetical protein